ncbi:MAG TPA: acylneuraminate cytidylyltransferase [Limnochordales bacterium]
MLQAVAIIPARGGSKGVPRKNVRPLCGKPLLAWMIEAAQQAAAIDRVVVSTDDPEIAAVSRRWGAEVIHRPPELAGDTTSSEQVLLHALQQLGVDRGALAFLQCTAPLTLPEDIDGTLALLARADSAFTAAPWHGFPWVQAAGPAGAVPEPLGHDHTRRPLRQERRGLFLEVGAVYAVDVTGFLRARHRFFGRVALYPIPRERSLEIDDETDWLLAETLLRRRLERERAARLPRPLRALVMDFDGVLTDNRVVVDQDGREEVSCHRGDGWALAQLRAAGVILLVLTQETGAAVQHRCRKLGVPCVVAPAGKLPALQQWLARHGLDPRSVAYVGNDAPDVPCMLYCGCGVAPADAAPIAKAAAQIVLDSPGGQGCIRELLDLAAPEVALHAAAPHRG